MNRPHTLRTIAEATGREKRTVQYWYQQAKEQHRELGELINGTRHIRRVSGHGRGNQRDGKARRSSQCCWWLGLLAIVAIATSLIALLMALSSEPECWVSLAL